MKCSKETFAGQARSRIAIENFVLTGDDYGGGDNVWTEVGKFWAIIKPSSGREVFASEQLQSRTTHKITIRYNSSFSNTKDFAKYRIKFESRYFNIRHVRNFDDDMETEGKSFQEISAEENAAIFA